MAFWKVNGGKKRGDSLVKNYWVNFSFHPEVFHGQPVEIGFFKFHYCGSVGISYKSPDFSNSMVTASAF